MFMLQEIYNRLNNVQLGILIFWGLCVLSFWIVFFKLIVMIIRNKFYTTQKF